MLGSSNTSVHGERFEDNTKRLRQEPRCGVEVLVPNVCVNNKQDEMSGEDCDTDTVGIGINPDDDDDDRQQQPPPQQHERKDEEEKEDDDNDDDDDDSDSDDSSSDDSSSGSGSDSDSDSRTRSMDAGKDCAPAPTARPCSDQKADQLQPPVKKEQAPVKKEPHCGDVAESREIKSEPMKVEMMGSTAPVQEHIHRLELEAYAALMKAFHACGDALSWEKEGLLSDLRVHLHVSNDEHLQVLNVILNRKRRTGGPR